MVDLIGMNKSVSEFEKIDILGIPVDKVTTAQALEAFEDFLNTDGLSFIATPNPEIILASQKDPEIVSVLKAADLKIPDGTGIVKASSILGQPLSERVTGIDFSYAALKQLAALGKSVYLLGSRPGIAEKAAANLAEQIPGLKIAGFHDGYFKPAEEDSLVQEINSSGADLLCVAMGAPRQELFIYRHRNELSARAAIGIGGSLDVWSGELSRAPQFYIDHNIEWVYRLKQEPSRIKRIWKLPLFLIKVYIQRGKNGH